MPPHATAECIDTLAGDRFLVRQRLGSGVFGVVYEAYDRARDEPVAIKVFAETEPELLYRWKRGFRRLAGLGHPNLVQLRELASDGDVWWVGMELVEGVELRQHLGSHRRPRKGRVNGVDFDRIREATAQIVEGLAFLHGNGVLHGNLKPSNVVIGRDGRVRLLDYGLVEEMLRYSRSLTSSSEGLLPGEDRTGWQPNAYSAPELSTDLAAREICSASDFYSLGAILYEGLTGITVGAGNDRRPGDRFSGVPADLDQLCEALLRPSPEDRPNAREILARIGRTGVGAIETGRGRSGQTAAFVGRLAELDALERGFETAADGDFVLRWVEASSGLGKTALVERFCERLARRGTASQTVLLGRSFRQETVPYKVFDVLVDGLSRHLVGHPGDLDPGFVRSQTGALQRLFPVLRRVPALAEHQRDDELVGRGPERVRERGFFELHAVLRGLAERRPLVLVLEDVQWGDADSAVLFSRLVRQGIPNCLVLVTLRPEERDSSSFMSHLEPEVAERGGRIPLASLDESEARELVRRVVGPVLGLGASSQALVEQVVVEGGGDPFLLTTLAGAAVDGWGAVGKAGDSTPPLTVAEIVRRQLASLPSPQRQLLEIVAIAEQPIAVDLARRAAGLALGDDSGAIDLLAAEVAAESLERLGLVRLGGEGRTETVEPRHERVREALLGLLPENVRRDRNRQLASVLEQSQAPGSAAAAAVHYSRTEEESRAARYAVEAAEQALEQLAFDRAARLLKLAISLGASGLDSSQLRARLGDTLSLAGRGAEAAGEYLEAVRRGSTRSVVELQLRAAEQLLISGHVDRGVRILRHVFRALDLPVPLEGDPLALVTALRRRWMSWRDFRFDPRDEGEVDSALLLRVDALWTAAVGLRSISPKEADGVQVRHLQLALRAGEPRRVARALALEAFSSSAGGTRTEERTRLLLARATELAEELGDPESMARAALAAVMTAIGLGQWARAVQISRQAASLFNERCVGVAWERRTNEDLLLQGLNGLGDFRKIVERVPVLLEEAHEYDDRYFQNLLGIWWARALVVQDRAEEAMVQLSQAVEQWPGDQVDLPCLTAQLVEIEVALYRGDPAAWDLLRARWRRVEAAGILSVQIVRVRLAILAARAALLRAGHCGAEQRRRYLEVARREIERVEREGTGWGDDLALTLRATLAQEQGDTRRALEGYRTVEIRTREKQTLVLSDICRWRQGELIGGQDGERLIEEARTSLDRSGVANPERLCALFVPRVEN